jgi:hypothetical protein
VKLIAKGGARIVLGARRQHTLTVGLANQRW